MGKHRKYKENKVKELVNKTRSNHIFRSVLAI